MLDLFTTQPVITAEPSVIHIMDGDFRARGAVSPERAAAMLAYNRANPDLLRGHQAEYRKRHGEALRKRQRDWMRQKRAAARAEA